MSHLRATLRPLALLAAAWAMSSGVVARGQGPPTPPVERLETREGRRVAGHLVAAEGGRFAFAVEGGAEPIPEDQFASWAVEPPASSPSRGVPPFQVVLAPTGRLSGRLIGVDGSAVKIEPGPGRPAWSIARGGVSAIIQRPGELLALRDDFEALDLARWSQGGDPTIAGQPRLTGEHALSLPSGGSSITTRMSNPVASGRLEVAYHEDGTRAPGQRWYADLSFRKPNSELSTVRVVPGWSEETLAVETPGGPSLNIQPLARKPGWRRLTVKFDDRRIMIAVDGDELAHGQGPGGPLAEVRFATEAQGGAAPADGLAAAIDDLRLVYFAEPSGQFETDPSQDEVRLVTGDQIFGRLVGSDADAATLEVEGKPLRFGWSEVSGLVFRRDPVAAKPIRGRWVRVAWRAAPGEDPRELDRAEGVLAGLDASSVTFDVPYLGRVSVPRPLLRTMEFLPRSTRLVLDPTAHHLGDRVVPDLDPPQPESTPLTLGFDLPEPPPGDVSLALDVVQVIGEEGTPVYSDLVKKGQLRTRLAINGRPLDDLNTHVTVRNDAPIRVRIPIPAGALVAGKNTLSITQTGSRDEPGLRDNLGLLGVALEWSGEEPGKP